MLWKYMTAVIWKSLTYFDGHIVIFLLLQHLFTRYEEYYFTKNMMFIFIIECIKTLLLTVIM